MESGTERDLVNAAISKHTLIKVRVPTGKIENGYISGTYLKYPVVHTQSGLQAQFARETLVNILLGHSVARF